MSVKQIIEDRLTEAFAPEHLDVINESHLHLHHKGSPGTGESHFRITIISAAFQGKSRLDTHRMINDLLADQLAGPIHALAIKASAVKN